MITDEQMQAIEDKTGNAVAPEGTVFVCGACGKTSKTRYGMSSNKTPGWDESCMLNSVLVRVEHITEPKDWQPYMRVKVCN